MLLVTTFDRYDTELSFCASYINVLGFVVCIQKGRVFTSARICRHLKRDIFSWVFVVVYRSKLLDNLLGFVTFCCSMLLIKIADIV